MTLRLAGVALLVRDYDEAIEWLCHKLGLTLIEDTRLEETKRWVRLGAGPAYVTSILLAQASNDEQRSQIGRQAGGRVAFFLETDDFKAAHRRMLAAGVTFRENPRYESYGTVAVFSDLYANAWDLVQPRR